MFVVDSSGSIRDRSLNNWDLLLQFLARICENFTIGQDGVRVGLVEYSEDARNVFFLNQHNDIGSLRNAILSTPYLGSFTNTSGGIRVMHLEQFTAQRGDRPSVPNLAIVVTDGESNLDQFRTISDAQAAQASGIQMVSVGITDAVNVQELRGISSPPQELNQNWFQSSDFNQLLSVLNVIITPLCESTGPQNLGK